MLLSFTNEGWEDYFAWQKKDKKIIKRINSLINEMLRTPFSGTGKPEALKFNLSGLWSRRINDEHRLVYEVTKKELIIHQCKYHY